MVEVLIDTKGRLLTGPNSSPVSGADSFLPALLRGSPFGVRVGLIESPARNHRGTHCEALRFLPLKGKLFARISAPTLKLGQQRVRVILGQNEGSQSIRLDQITRRSLEELVNSMPSVRQAGGARVIGCECSRGMLYRIIWRKRGKRPPLRVSHLDGPETGICCRCASVHRGSDECRAVAEILVRNSPSLAFCFCEAPQPPSVAVSRHGPAFGAAGHQIDRVRLAPGSSGGLVLRVPGGTPTQIVEPDATGKALLTALDAVSPGTYTSALRVRGGWDLLHATTGVQPAVEVDGLHLKTPQLHEATMAVAPLLRDLLLGCSGRVPLILEIFTSEVSTACNRPRAAFHSLYRTEIQLDLDQIDMSNCNCEHDLCREVVTEDIEANATFVDVPYPAGATFQSIQQIEILGPGGVSKGPLQDMGTHLRVNLVGIPAASGTHKVRVVFEFDCEDAEAPPVATDCPKHGIFAADQTPDGTVNTFSSTQISEILMVFENGDLVGPSEATISGSTVVFTPGNTPQPGDRIEVYGILV